MKKFFFLLISSMLLCVATAVMTYIIVAQLKSYSDKKKEIAKILDAEERLTNLWEWVPEPFNMTSEEKVEEWRSLEDKADEYYDDAVLYGWILAMIVAGYALLNMIVYWSSKVRARAMGMATILASLSFLYLGLQTPFLEISAFKDDVAARLPIEVDFENNWLSQAVGLEGLGQVDEELAVEVSGRVYFLYQNKSIIQLLDLLWNGGNKAVAVFIFIFSMAFPAIKLISSLYVFARPHGRSAVVITTAVNKLGKWSMADVFVAAIFLAYFSFANMNVGVDTSSSTLIGIWFFMAFVMLSIFSGAFLRQSITGGGPEALENKQTN
jgi:hypothetical protein